MNLISIYDADSSEVKLSVFFLFFDDMSFLSECYESCQEFKDAFFYFHFDGPLVIPPPEPKPEPKTQNPEQKLSENSKKSNTTELEKSENENSKNENNGGDTNSQNLKEANLSPETQNKTKTETTQVISKKNRVPLLIQIFRKKKILTLITRRF